VSPRFKVPIVAYSRNELQQELSKNLVRLNQLRLFHRIVDTRMQVAQANTYTDSEYGNAVLGKYQKYLALVYEGVLLRTQCDLQLQTAVREESAPPDLEKTLKTASDKDYDIYLAWIELLNICPDSLNKNLDLENRFLETQKKRELSETLSAKPGATHSKKA
jgi:hypothetical protein